MAVDVSEKDFEHAIEASLLAQGYRKRTSDHYDEKLCLDPDCLLDFLQATQPKLWEKLSRQHDGDPRDKFLERVRQQIKKKSTVRVLREGVKDRGCRFRFAYFRPSSGLNEELRKLYRANQFSVIRQLHYSERDAKLSLDLVLFLNGLPLFTVEIKNPFKDQDVRKAMRQYKTDRDPREPLFAFGRCAAHFALDTNLAYFTTQLRGDETRFFPFNRGYNEGAGNPPSRTDFPTAYLWKDVWSPDSVLELVHDFIHTMDDTDVDEQGRPKTIRKLIFPRFHQREAVRRLVHTAREEGPGHKYLIQHSAGSGKSNTIAWLAHRLSSLHDENDRRVFDTILVITDRIVLDRQLQDVVWEFQKTPGVVEKIDGNSGDLRRALEAGKQIVISTLQKFSVIEQDARAEAGRRFAVLIDEAHSSQSGEGARGLKRVLSADTLEEAAQAEEDADPETLEDRIRKEIERAGPAKNVSFFAFTATPKQKTLELFGRRRPDGTQYEPFSLYSMRQAIEEGFILDVLQNYTTYKAYWELWKSVEDDPRVDSDKAKRVLRVWVSRHEHAIDKKVDVILDHFVNHVREKIDGQAKAMVVTRSRLHAVRTFLALREKLQRRGLPFQALVAFSGTVPDGEEQYTESGLNGFPYSRTKDAFRRPESRFLVVAEKFQTGFDEPLLHTMYVDKRLSGVHAVQTLSRLNRIHPSKEETIVLDFVNEAETIQKSFEDYYRVTLLSEGTDPNQLYDLEDEILEFRLFDERNVEAVAEIWWGPGRVESRQPELIHLLAPVVERYDALDEATQHDVRGALKDYIRLYAFLAQIIEFRDTRLEKLYVYARLQRPRLTSEEEELPLEVQEAVDMESFGLRKTSQGSLELEGRGEPLRPMTGASRRGGYTPEKLEALSEIIEDLNRKFGGIDEPEVIQAGLEFAYDTLRNDPSLDAAIRANTRDNARLKFDQTFKSNYGALADTHWDFYQRLVDDREFSEYLGDRMFDLVIQDRRQAERLVREHESKTLEFKSTLRWDLDREQKNPAITHATLKTIAAFLNTEGGDLLLGVRDDGSVLGIEPDGFDSYDQFLLHLAQIVRNALGSSASTRIDPRMQLVEGKPVCVVACDRSPDPVWLQWKEWGREGHGDFYVRSGPGSVALEASEVPAYIRSRFGEMWLEELEAEEDVEIPAETPLPFRRVEPSEDDKFTTAVPLVPLEAAAGTFREAGDLGVDGLEDADDWVEPATSHRLRPGMFVARVQGKSMEPKIPDGAYCLFRSPVEGSRLGKTVLVLLEDAADPEHAGHYTVKKYISRKEQTDDGSWQHLEIRLQPQNQDFEALLFKPDDVEAGRLRVVAEVVDVL